MDKIMKYFVNEKIEISDISKYRTELMGFAIICIMLCHNILVFPNDTLQYINAEFIRPFFQFGVDIFFLVSGLGCAHSLSRKPKAGQFYQKRAARLLPTYLFITLSYCGISQVVWHNQSLREIFQKYSLITFFSSGELTEWFVASILVLYLLSPLLSQLLKKNTVIFVLCIVGVSIISNLLPFFSMSRALYLIDGIFLIRIPVFLFGMLLNEWMMTGKNKKIDKKIVYLAVLVTLGLYIINILWNSSTKLQVGRTLFFPFSVCTCFILANFFNHRELKFVKKALTFLGGITLEIYLLHEKLQGTISSYLQTRFGDGIAVQLTVLVFSIAVAVLSAKIFSEIIEFFKKKLAEKAKKREKAYE